MTAPAVYDFHDRTGIQYSRTLSPEEISQIPDYEDMVFEAARALDRRKRRGLPSGHMAQIIHLQRSE